LRAKFKKRVKNCKVHIFLETDPIAFTVILVVVCVFKKLDDDVNSNLFGFLLIKGHYFNTFETQKDLALK